MNAVLPGGPVPDPAMRVPPRPRRRRFGIVALCAGAACAAIVFGQDWWRHGRFVETTDDAYVGGDVTAIAPHIAGFVSDLLVADNAHVDAGQLLARIDARDSQAAFDRAQASVAAEGAALASLRAQRGVQLAAIRQSGAELSGRSARAAFALVDSRRYAALSLTRSGSPQDAERARAAEQEARAATESAQAGLSAARAQLDVLDAQILQAGAALARDEADLRRARLDLGYTEIRAPAEGFAANRAVRPGSYVAAGTYLLSVVPARGLWVDANFKEDQLASIRPGQPASMVADAAPGVVFHGKVLSLAPGTGATFSVIPPENATGNFTRIVQRVPVRIELAGADAVLDRLRPGLTVTVGIDTRAP